MFFQEENQALKTKGNHPKIDIASRIKPKLTDIAWRSQNKELPGRFTPLRNSMRFCIKWRIKYIDKIHLRTNINWATKTIESATKRKYEGGAEIEGSKCHRTKKASAIHHVSNENQSWRKSNQCRPHHSKPQCNRHKHWNIRRYNG